ncbi:hypothetical protein DPSP01_001028 [Paraphaeosphaeria sporulosa]|uniref:Yeast cell wall synthesis Kre9/Knh1-like N-terminal domain-containing protein n=1 Tax=Paraphaeosphaeria sporulosa TaxID=1460663 RepID=A0A177C5V3_9PLEO|nr:uncharacterized protein CC84DRAFT_1179057 [Paraphaeosphaeria sporulosa]OAG02107.1 hypothetical protein CC84DRAFT_1179057 [Paraphaeosphaeria sporulosa]
MKYSVVAFFAGLAAAYHAPVGAPTGNAITAPLVQTIPAGKPFTITWTADSPNKVSLLLLKGPSTNAVFNQVIVESIDNSGSYTWTPPTSLEGTDGPGGYGIQLIDDVDGHYQYSTQFGISNEKPVSSAAPVSSSAYESSAPAPKPTISASGYAVSSSSVEVPSSTEASTSCTTTTTIYAPAPPVGTGASSGAPPSSVIYPTGPVTVPESLKTSATGGYIVPTSTPAVEFPGAASGLQAGLGLAGAVAALVAML